MDERTHGLILRTRPLTESSLIVQWLTPGLGRIATVAKGARRPKSSFRGKLDLYFLAEFTFARSRRSDLHTLREVSIKDTHPPLRANLDYLRQAAYCAALIEQTTETESPLPGPYQLLTGLLQHLPSLHAQPATIFAFEMKLLQELGLCPNLTDAALPPGTRMILGKLLQSDWPNLAHLRLSPAQATQVQAWLHGFLTHHLDRIPRNRTQALLN